ncbi:MAG: alpha/beta fold hydrolase [Candidatus Thiodiazotropha endolucinida]
MNVNFQLQIFWGTILVLLLVFVVTGCGSGDNKSSSSVVGFAEKADSGLRSMLESAVEQEDVSNGALIVDIPSRSYLYRGASGIAQESSGRAMTASDSFRIASTTKTFTAVIVLQLIEEGYLSLDTPLREIFSDADMPDEFKLADLHVMDGIARGGEITVRQLLNHTSGLEDYFSYNNETSDGPDFLAFLDALSGGKAGFANHQWSAEELLAAYFMNGRGNRPTHLPGEQHYYSDTNYVLLGVIIEKITGDSYANQLRFRILDPLGMSNSYLEWYEPDYGTAPVDHYLNMTEDLGETGNLNIVDLDINTSYDWAGGGLVSTVEDLNIFLRALFRGDLFQHAETLVLMKNWVHSEDDTFYGLGLERGSVRGYAYFGHSGFWGSNMFYFPELDTSVVLWINQTFTDRKEYLSHVLVALTEAGLEMSNSDLESITMGNGSPTVVFDTGLGDEMTNSWGAIFDEVADITTAFAYNRRGYGNSVFAFPGDSISGRSAAEIVNELRATLDSEGLAPPYLLVGHSLGGINMELFAKLYPDQVAGVVFVDPRPVGMTEACIAAIDKESCTFSEQVLNSMPDHIRSEALGAPESEQLIRGAGNFGDIPVFVLSKSRFDENATDNIKKDIFQSLLKGMADQSTRGVYREIPDTGHWIQRDAPEAVIEAIQEIIGLIQ